jgi:predicted cupin superfamily sugar epimerase
MALAVSPFLLGVFMTADEIIRLLQLQPHPEGGFYRETYRSENKIPDLDRVYSTGIYYMLVTGVVSKLHALKHDEMFHFYLGNSVTWVLLHKNGAVEKVVLGQDIVKGQQLQLLVKAGTWFGGYLNDGGLFGLMGTTVAPGFDFADFVFGQKEKLLTEFPSARSEINRLA